MKITIVTPVLNDALQMQGCLESIDRQEYDDWEHVIVDGGSADGLEALLEDYQDPRRKFLLRPGTSMYEAIDEGFVDSPGEIQCWLNADDRWEPMALAAVAKVFRERSDIDWLSGIPASRVNGLIQSVKPNLYYPSEIIKLGLCDGVSYPFLTQEVLFWRRTLKERVGNFPVNLRYAGDFWLWTQFAAHAPLVRVQAILGAFTRRKGQLSELRKDSYREEVRRVQKSLYSRSLRQGEKRRMRFSCYLNRAGRFWPRMRKASYFPLTEDWKKVSILRISHGWDLVETRVEVDLWGSRKEKLGNGIRNILEQM